MMEEQLKQQITRQGMSVEKAEEQIRNFENNFPYLNIQAPALLGDGIMQLSEQKLQDYIETYESGAAVKVIEKFVPASGAASRMFKELYAFLEADDASLQSNSFTEHFLSNISSFAFYEDLDQSLKKAGSSIDDALAQKKHTMIVRYLLDEEGLGYGSLPKGLLKFHTYPDETRTPVHEHFVEGALYGMGRDNTV